MKKTVKVVLFLIFTFSLLVVALSANATAPVATYLAPTGLKIVSFSNNWETEGKLSALYQELLNNTHGEEIDLLSEVRIYAGPNRDDPNMAGQWIADWETVTGKVYAKKGAIIELYNGRDLSTPESLSRTLAHEYGHHFTYYYYFKKENIPWSQWNNSEYANIRGLTELPKVSDTADEHAWSIQEIAAEDYVQLFGSLSAKQSYNFEDIQGYLDKNYSRVTYWDDTNNFKTYNSTPQENRKLPLAANMKGLKEYWLQASGLTDQAPAVPANVTLQLKEVNSTRALKPLQYIFSWNDSGQGTHTEYTLVKFELENGQVVNFMPIKTTLSGKATTAAFGSASNQRYYVWQEVPDGIAYFVLYVINSDKNAISSDILAVDFSNIYKPDTVLIDNTSLLKDRWLIPRVKINDKQMTFDVDPVVKNGRTLVPLRAIFEELGAKIEWDAVSQTISATKEDSEISLKIGSKQAIVNGETVNLDVPATVIEGRTLVPLRFVAEALGASVAWNANLKLASIKQ